MNKRAAVVTILIAAIAASALYSLFNEGLFRQSDKAANNGPVNAKEIAALFSSTSERLNTIAPDSDAEDPVVLIEELFDEGLSELNQSLSEVAPDDNALTPIAPAVVPNSSNGTNDD